MGDNTKKLLRWEASQSQLAARGVLDAAQQRFDIGERNLGSLQSVIGSERQLGLSEADAAVLDYTQRYSVAEGGLDNTFGFKPHLGALAGSRPGANPYVGRAASAGGGILGYTRATVEDANAMLDQAEEAARSGDFETAQELKGQANELIERNRLSGVAGANYSDAITLDYQPGTSTDSLAASPQGQLVGQQVRQARGYLDRDSEETRAFRESLTGGPLATIEADRVKAERTIVAQHRENVRAIRDLGAARGAGRSRMEEASLEARTGEAAALNIANVRLDASARATEVQFEASKFYETYKDQYAKEVTILADEWMKGQPGIRDEYQNRNLALAQSAADVNVAIAGQKTQAWLQLQAEDQAEDAQWRQNITSIAAAAGGIVLGGGLGAIGALAAGASASGVVGAAVTGATAGLSGGAAGRFTPGRQVNLPEPYPDANVRY